MKAKFSLNFTQFEKSLQVAISKVERGTKKATRAACEQILAQSLQEVPKATGTLASSAFYEIQRAYRNFTATVGYGGNNDPINPETGAAASSYMLEVHEDLAATHFGTKAKFLEDPVNEYGKHLTSYASEIIRSELGG